MSLQMAERTAALFNENPRLGDYLQGLNEAGARWALSASAAVFILTGIRLPSDADVIIADDSVDAAFGASPADAQIHDGPEEFHCGDGLVLDFPRRGRSFKARAGELPVDVIDTREARDGNHVYRLGLSELALKHRLEIPVDGPRGLQVVYVANPFDVIAMKAVMQRGPDVNKYDFLDVEAILLACGIDPSYAVERAREIGLRGREWSFLGRAGLQASVAVFRLKRVHGAKELPSEEQRFYTYID